MSITLRRLKLILPSALILILALPSETFAQKEIQSFTAKNALYVEFGGSSGRYAVNYSRIVHQKGKLKVNVSGGFSLFRSSITMRDFSSTKWLPVIPLEFSALLGRSNHHLEAGVGFTSFLDQGVELDLDTYETTTKVAFGAVIPFRLGYRYQKPGGGFFYRVAYTPFFDLPFSEKQSISFQPYYAGLSIGKSF